MAAVPQDAQWQFFSGMPYYQPKLPWDPTQIGRIRRVLVAAGIGEPALSIGDGSLTFKRCGHRGIQRPNLGELCRVASLARTAARCRPA